MALKGKQFFIILVILSLFFVRPILAVDIPISSAEIDEIQEKINKQQEKIQDLEDQKKVYQEKIDIKRKEAVTLQNQLDILKNQIAQRELEIEQQEDKIEETNLLIESIQFKILAKKQEIKNSKSDLEKLLQIINLYDRKNFLEIIFLNDSISGVLNHVRYLNSFQSEAALFLKRITLIKEGLETQEENLRLKLKDLIDLKTDLQNKKAKYAAEKQFVQTVLDETRGAEWKFQSLLAEAITESREIENEIATLEQEAREKIAEEKLKKAELMEAEGIIVFSWPVPVEGITCSFHDPDYPYRKWLGEHPAIDLRAKQGTPVRAAASGYIAKAKNGGMGYSYVMIVHNDSFSTVYGHLSVISVEEGEFVKRSAIIGWSGGLPGTSGAGNFSTGPHLHFEVRLNGIPVNPEDYLL